MTISTSPALVVATCAVAGSGKTTFARRLEAGGYVRLSVDQVIWQRLGAYDVDYPAGRYEELSAIARDVVRGRLAQRAARRDADAAFEITQGRLAGYLDGFETPAGEGEVVLTPDQATTWWPSPHR